MQDNATRKTLTYLLVAGMAVLVAWEPWRPAPSIADAPKGVGEKLFPDFKSALDATSLEIVTFDERTATIDDFKVAQVDGVWSIPSHSNYPADAQEHMAAAANALRDVEILNVVSDSPGDQELYGVIAPDASKIKPGATGVGIRVTLKDAKDKALADLIIGKEDKDQPQLRFVRKADRDQIYKVSVKTDKLSTKFGDWIEKNLLKLNAFDVKQLDLNDYSTQQGVNAQGEIAFGLNQRATVKLTYDDAKSAWNLTEMATFDEEGNPVPTKLADDEELNVEKLNNLRNALNDLQIVDVERKPAGLSQDLRTSDEFIKNREAMQSLLSRGFYAASRGGGPPEIFSSEGEATVTTKDGVRYVLRFGNLAGGGAAKDDGKEEKDKSNPALNRYLFVAAQFDESQIAKPELEEVPAGGDQPAGDKPAEGKAESDQAEGGKDDEKPAEKSDGEDKNVPEKKTAAQDDDKPAAEAAKDDAKADATEPAPEETKADTSPPKTDIPARPEMTPEEKKVAVERENKRKQDEYDTAIKKGRDKVKELNDRFADWYYIISDDVYKKIHLTAADIVKKKDAPKEEAAKSGVNELDALKQGLTP